MPTNPKTYPASWTGLLVLACRKCQKKLKHDPHWLALAKLKKTVKRHNREHPEQMLHIINVPCMDLCPKDGVTVCLPSRDPHRLLIMGSAEDFQKIARHQ